MGIWSRIKLIFRSKANKALDSMEDTSASLDFAYDQQRKLLSDAKRSQVDIVTGRKRAEVEVHNAEQEIEKLTAQAKKAIDVGREDLARTALTRKAQKEERLGALRENLQRTMGEEQKIGAAVENLTAKVEQFRTEKESIKAQYKTAEAQVKITEQLNGLDGSLDSSGAIIDRARGKVGELQARASALDELGVQQSWGGDALDAELNALSASSKVEQEIAALKGELPSGSGATVHALNAGDTHPDLMDLEVGIVDAETVEETR